MPDKLKTSNHTITIRTLLLRDIGGLFLIALGAVLAVTLYFGNQGGLIVIRENANATINSIKQTLSIHIQPALKAAEFIGHAGWRPDECQRSGHGMDRNASGAAYPSTGIPLE